MLAKLAALPAVMILSIALAGCDLFVEPSGPTPDDFARARAAYDQTEPAPDDDGASDADGASGPGDRRLKRVLLTETREGDARLAPEPRAQN
jgi:hypothetical protein